MFFEASWGTSRGCTSRSPPRRGGAPSASSSGAEQKAPGAFSGAVQSPPRLLCCHLRLSVVGCGSLARPGRPILPAPDGTRAARTLSSPPNPCGPVEKGQVDGG